MRAWKCEHCNEPCFIITGDEVGSEVEKRYLPCIEKINFPCCDWFEIEILEFMHEKMVSK
jgi:hypothetical protein